MQYVSISDVALHANNPTYSLLPWMLIYSTIMQPVSINDVAFSIAPLQSCLLLVAMDTIMNNAESKYQ